MTIERATIVKADFTRWLPAIAETTNRKAALSITGVAVLGGLAFGPTAAATPVTAGPHERAVAAIDLATGQNREAAPAEAAPTTGEEAATGGTSAEADTPSAGRDTPSAEADTPSAASDRPSRDELIPHDPQGAQSRIPLDDAQVANAREIIEAAKETGVGERGAVIGVATSLQESKLYNLGHLGAYNDHDSQGLFQQRPSSGWGTPSQITDPEYASKAFFHALRNVDGWRELPLTVAAQTVQVSAYPYAYAQWEEQAADIVHEHW